MTHLARHEIRPNEAEEVMLGTPAIGDHDVVNGEDRWRAVGVTLALRVLVLVFTVRNGQIRVITGWPANKKAQRDFFAGMEM